jgi:hypothetical protein
MVSQVPSVDDPHQDTDFRVGETNQLRASLPRTLCPCTSSFGFALSSHTGPINLKALFNRRTVHSVIHRGTNQPGSLVRHTCSQEPSTQTTFVLHVVYLAALAKLAQG